jgi:hypothetical protein
VLSTLHKLVQLEMDMLRLLLPEHGHANTARLKQEQTRQGPPECRWIDTLDWALGEDRFPAGVDEDGSVD